jgi:hypothetical protein
MSNQWYIGQEIVCIRTHSRGIVKSGEIYKIVGLSTSKCKCRNLTLIDVGFKATADFGRCGLCNTRYPKLRDAWWLNEILFAPLEYDQNEIEKLLEITIKEKI